MNQTKKYILLVLLALGSLPMLKAQRRELVDFFLPMKPQTPLVSNGIWGEANVLPRDTANGLEDPTLKEWCFWDGMISKADNGKYYMYSSAWKQTSSHHDGWTRDSKAITAVSDNPMGPYRDIKESWPHWNNGKAHNVMGLRMHDGRYAMVTSEITRGEIFTSDNPDGPWEFLDTIQVDPNGYKLTSVKYWWDHHMSNVMILPRPDGKYMIVPRQCVIMISDNIEGPYKIMGTRITNNQPDLADYMDEMLEDPTVWYSGGLYHIVVNQHRYGIAFHFTSEDGINNWKYRGKAFDTDGKTFRYTNGTLNNWFTVQRPVVFCENGHPTHFTFSVIDAHKGDDNPNDNNGSKIIVVPFDGEAFDAHMAEVIAEEKRAEELAKLETPNKDGDINLLNSHYYGFEKVANIEGAGWHNQHPECWSFSKEKRYSGDYALKFANAWVNDGMGRIMVHGCDYVNYALARPNITAGRKHLSFKVFVEEGTPNNLFIDFKSDPYNQRATFDLSKVKKGEWVEVSQLVNFEEDFTDHDASVQISVNQAGGAPQSTFYIDDVRLEPRFLSKETPLNKEYYGFEMPKHEDRIGYMSRWMTNSGYNYTPQLHYVTRDPYIHKATFSVIDRDDSNETVKPYEGNHCLKFDFWSISKYESSWFRTLCNKDGDTNNDLWLAPGKKYKLSYMLNITSDKMFPFYICLKKNGKNYPIKTSSDKVKERNKWVTVESIVDLTDEPNMLGANLELLYKVSKEPTTFYIDNIELVEL